MFLVVYLPIMGEFQIIKYTLINVAIAAILGLLVKESVYERIPRSTVFTDDSDAHERRTNRRQWQCAIWGFR